MNSFGFQFDVDTRPMAREIARVSERVEVASTAVVVMQTAVVASQQEAADHVCENVNRGFYSLIRSQISQKMAKLQSDVDSNLMQMVQQRKALLGIRMRMERDFHMIASRYKKLFGTLNANLRARVFALDKPTADFACKDVETIHNRTKYLAATVPLAQTEGLQTSQRILASNIRSQGFAAINSMTRFIEEWNEQKRLADIATVGDRAGRISGKTCMPIVLMERTQDSSGQVGTEVYVPGSARHVQIGNVVREGVYRQLSGMRWSSPKAMDVQLAQECERMVSSSTLHQRVKEYVRKMCASSTYVSLGG